MLQIYLHNANSNHNSFSPVALELVHFGTSIVLLIQTFFRVLAGTK